MFVNLGIGSSAIILNTDKILAVSPLGGTTSELTFTNGTSEVVELTFATLADVPGFHVFECLLGNSGRTGAVMVNTGHLVSARATPDEGVSYLHLSGDRSTDALPLRLRISMGMSELQSLLEREGSPAPGM